LIDCRTLDTDAVPLPDEVLVVILDTATRRELSGSAYNERRVQCEAAAKHFGVEALRDLTPAEFDAGVAGLDPVAAARGRHVVRENARTLEAAEVMRRGDARRLGELMADSHQSLRDDFAVSNEPLDVMVEVASGHPACFGARMTGAGFGGCAVAIVDREGAEDFVAHAAGRYRERTGLEPRVYVSGAAEGASVESAVEAGEAGAD